MPAAEMAWVVRARQASTTDGAARSATSRIAPGPLPIAIASRSTLLASRATTRTVGLSCLASSAISRLSASSSSAQITAVASGDPGGHQTLRSRDHHDLGTGVLQLLDDPQSQRVVSADDGVAVHSEHATSENLVATGEDGPMPSGPKIYVKACINGARTPDEHPNLPVTPEQLAAAAVAAHGAGAKAVHMHPKTADGVDSLHPEIVGAAVAAVRQAAPGLPLGVTTGFWALPDADERLRAVEAWTVLPDFASVNWHEPGSEELAEVAARAWGSASRSASSTPRPRRRGRSRTSPGTACG